MNFKPNKKKVVISIIITLVWAFFLYISTSVICSCIIRKSDCVDYYYISPIGRCHCDCWPLERVIKNYLIAFVLPFILVYILLSLIEKKK